MYLWRCTTLYLDGPWSMYITDKLSRVYVHCHHILYNRYIATKNSRSQGLKPLIRKSHKTVFLFAVTVIATKTKHF